jgi:O-antigen/teichoic acid export membrane protein
MILSNTLYQIVGKIFTAGSGLAVTALISKYLGIYSLGEYAIMMSFIAPFYLFFDLGLNPTIVGKSARGEFDLSKQLGGVYLLRIAISLLVICFAIIILLFTPYTLAIKYGCFIALFTILFQSLTNTSLIHFQTKLLFKYNTLSQIAGSVFLVLFVYIAVSLQASLLVIALGFLSSTIIIFLVGLLFILNNATFSNFRLTIEDASLILKESLPLAIAVSLSGLNAGADKFLLSLYLPKEQNAYYFLAYRIFEMALSIPFFLMQSLYPGMVKVSKTDKSNLNKVVSRAVANLEIFVFCFFSFAFIFGRKVLMFFWGENMLEAYNPLLILSAGMVIFAITSPLSWAIISLNKAKRLPTIYLYALLFNIVLNIVFIPRYGYIACAYTTIFSEIIILMLLFREYRLATKS